MLGDHNFIIWLWRVISKDETLTWDELNDALASSPIRVLKEFIDASNMQKMEALLLAKEDTDG